MGGNTPDAFNGPVMVSPSAMARTDFWIACDTTRLPAVLAVISSASSIETPEASRVARVRVNRATDDLRTRLPMTGMRRRALSVIMPPCGVRFHHMKPPSKPIAPSVR